MRRPTTLDITVPDKLFDGDFHTKMKTVNFTPRDNYTIKDIQKIRAIEEYN